MSCFWCDTESPINAYRFCANCFEKKQDGIMVLEVADSDALKRPEYVAGASPTGRWFMVSDDQFDRIAKVWNLAEHHKNPVKTNRRMAVEFELFETIAPKIESLES